MLFYFYLSISSSLFVVISPKFILILFNSYSSNCFYWFSWARRFRVFDADCHLFWRYSTWREVILSSGNALVRLRVSRDEIDPSSSRSNYWRKISREETQAERYERLSSSCFRIFLLISSISLFFLSKWLYFSKRSRLAYDSFSLSLIIVVYWFYSSFLADAMASFRWFSSCREVRLDCLRRLI